MTSSWQPEGPAASHTGREVAGGLARHGRKRRYVAVADTVAERDEFSLLALNALIGHEAFSVAFGYKTPWEVHHSQVLHLI